MIERSVALDDRLMSSRMRLPISGIAICVAVFCVIGCAHKAESHLESSMQYGRFTTFVVDLRPSESSPPLDSPETWWLNTGSTRYHVDGRDARLPIWQSMVEFAVRHTARLYVEVDPKTGLVKEIFNTKNDFVESVGVATDRVVTVLLRRRPTRVTLSVDDPDYQVMRIRLEHATASQSEVRVTVHPDRGTLLHVEELE